ncbi:hypothetical protein CH373_13515 [Leptospira perolatii]|uniref:Lipase modulator n=1 Tax=Leptospira perolatii TaxID=2023191 RepID=A0A2M9ZL05_9LEPT|nr:hypothetical protein [Leptospira perolatii]PJZ69877.1 hypothetical protein CH360_08170 [Leptospira perolatii]PJZ72715.1 hypothetical protein CH373_13515 [Leptospira perolatii]
MQSLLKNKIFLIVCAVGILCIGIIYYYLASVDPIERKFKDLSEHPIPEHHLNEQELELTFKSRAESGQNDSNLSIDEMAFLLRKRYGDQIDRPSVQISMLESLIQDLQKRFPDRWVELLQEILGAAFPGKENELFNLSEALYKYQKYYKDNFNRLNSLSQEKRQEELWKTRERLFGEKAKEIWAAEIKLSSISDALKKIETDKSSSIYVKLDHFKTALKSTYGQDLPRTLENKKQVFMEGFIRASQSDLQSMTASERKSALHEVRKNLGMDANALRRWEELDSERDKRWEAGRNYTKETESLQSKYKGQELEKKLESLREKYFGQEAETIQNEEASGYYRFKEDRVLGIE